MGTDFATKAPFLKQILVVSGLKGRIVNSMLCHFKIHYYVTSKYTDHKNRNLAES